MGGKQQSFGGFGGARVVGSNRYKVGKSQILAVDDDELEIKSGFNSDKFPLGDLAIASLSRQEIEEQFAADETVDLTKFEWKKDKPSWLVISAEDKEGKPVVAVFDDDKATEDVQMIEQRISHWQERMATTSAGTGVQMAAPMHKLGKKEEARVKENLLPGEKVICQCVGPYGQALVLTDRKALIIKTGFMAGSTFGAKVTSFDYRNITAVEVRMGPLSGAFQIAAGGMQASDKGYWGQGKQDAYKSPHMIPVLRSTFGDFQKAANLIRSMAADAGRPAPAATSQAGTPITPDPLDQLKKLGELRDAGVLTQVEFEAKKSELLARM
jgi:hypothetical protein